MDYETIRAVLNSYGISAKADDVARFGSGYIHRTYKVKAKQGGYILQRINKHVFQKPEAIAENIRQAAAYLSRNYPSYQFTRPLPSVQNEQMVWDSEGFPWRVFEFLENTYTVDSVENSEQAYNAAAAFALLTYNLRDADINLFNPTIEKFHDLSHRYHQLEQAISKGLPERLITAAPEIAAARDFKFLVDTYERLIVEGSLKLRITHNDTKINNVLFDSESGKAVAAIDLDTLMPGYFIYDIGDMIRTFVSPVDEGSTDLSRVRVRKEIYDAIVDGYLSVMGETLTAEESQQIPFAGMMMTYIMAIRMLADYLLGDVYYQITYPEQNLVRARNQLALLKQLKDFHAQ